MTGMSLALAHHPAAPPAARLRVVTVARWAAQERRLLPGEALAVVALVEAALPVAPWSSERVATLVGAATAWCRARNHAVPAGVPHAVWALLEHDASSGLVPAALARALQASVLAEQVA